MFLLLNIHISFKLWNFYQEIEKKNEVKVGAVFT